MDFSKYLAIAVTIILNPIIVWGDSFSSVSIAIKLGSIVIITFLVWFSVQKVFKHYNLTRKTDIALTGVLSAVAGVLVLIFANYHYNIMGKFEPLYAIVAGALFIFALAKMRQRKRMKTTV